MSEFILIPQKQFTDLEEKVNKLLEISSSKMAKMEDWISEKEAQALLGLKETSMWALRKRKQLVFSKIGSKTFYSLKSIERLLNKNQD